MTNPLQERFRARFIETTRGRLNKLGELIADSENGPALAHEFHAMAGEAAMIGFESIASEARGGEQAAKGCPDVRSLATCARHLRKLTAELRKLTDRKKRRVLVVDDSEIVCDQLLDGLSARGYEVRSASTRDALANALEGFSPNTVLLDLNVPGIDSETLCADLGRRISPAPAVVLVSGDDSDSLDNAVDRLGVTGGISKQRGIAAVIDYVASLTT